MQLYLPNFFFFFPFLRGKIARQITNIIKLKKSYKKFDRNSSETLKSPFDFCRFCSIKDKGIKAKPLWDRSTDTEVGSMTIEGTFHEIPRAARFHHRTQNERNRKLSTSMHSSRYTRVFLHEAKRDIRKEEVLCSRAKVICGDIHTCLRFRFLAVLNIERAGRVRPYVGRGCFATWRFHFDTLHSCRSLESSCPSL